MCWIPDVLPNASGELHEHLAEIIAAHQADHRGWRIRDAVG
jgi:hypothetical protein